MTIKAELFSRKEIFFIMNENIFFMKKKYYFHEKNLSH